MSNPLPDYLLPVTVPASWGWRGIIAMRNRRYDLGRGVHRADLPVISVGNLTTGGTGKTPMVRWIAERLRDDGMKPAVLLRGYGSADPDSSDEARLYRRELEGMPVIADPDRVGALRRHLASGSDATCAILDDGFQHRRLHRDLDLVLIDATRPLDSLRLLPAGHLREPLESLRRAHAVVVTRSKSVDPELAARIESLHGRPPLAWTDHQWTGLELHEGDAVRYEDCDWLSGRRFASRLGIGNPDAARRQLIEAGGRIKLDVPVRDHAGFGSAEVSRLIEAADGLDGVFMTAKDLVKAQPLLDAGCPIPLVVPRMRLRFHSGQAALVALLEGAMAS
ncbi:MAG: tetraacyldisaccharide 4'-kinase [Phycisphaerales bacterium]|nr:tetraacyldisaccharide 4'-kinase [Phycisphaerales bacterium]